MTDRLLAAWDWEPSVVIGCAVLALGYVAAFRRHLSSRAVCFLGAVFLLLLDLVSPIDALADDYLFSAHVVQHFFLAMVIPPLLLFGLPPRLRLPVPVPPLPGWILGVSAMLFWHLPAVFNAASANDALHVFEHVSLLATGVLFWQPVLGPPHDERLPAGIAVPYLFSSCTLCSLLGAAITWGVPGIYHPYLHPNDSLRILPLIRNDWGLDVRTDQQLGGLLMWVPGCFVYLTAILMSVARWYKTPRTAEA